MVLLMNLHMLGQIVDPLGQDCDLYLSRTGIGLVGSVFGNNSLLFFLEHHSTFTSYKFLYSHELSLRPGEQPR